MWYKLQTYSEEIFPKVSIWGLALECNGQFTVREGKYWNATSFCSYLNVILKKKKEVYVESSVIGVCCACRL